MGDPNFEQVVAIDAKFDLFTRAWCVAELAAAHRMGLRQSLKLTSRTNLKTFEARLNTLRIQEMKASRQEDIDDILEHIPDPDAFNVELRRLLLEDLIPDWKTLDSVEEV